MHLVTDYIVPCILCEDALEHVSIYRDPGTGRESSERVRLPHLCPEMQALIKEGR